MNRRVFLKQCALAAGAVGTIGSAVNAGVKLDSSTMNFEIGRRRPNVIFILADDLGYAELGCFGQKKIKTPNLDKLAAEGMKLTNHYSGNAVCAPSRCALMTGKHMGHAYIRDNYETGGYQLAIGDAEVTVAELFKQAGYQTGAMGKWGLGGPGTVGDPNNQGFDLFFGNLGQVQAHWYYPPHLWKNDQQVFYEGNTNDDGEHYSHDYMADEAIKFIEDNKDRPFFMYVPFLIPHVSLQVPQDSLDEYLEMGWPETPTSGSYPSYTGCDTPRATYAAMITRMDGDIGRIMDLLKQLKLDEDTIVIFSSDNGATYCCGVDYNFFDSVADLRGMKGSLYEGGIKVPLIARWPGKIKPGTTSGHISAFWDFLPTCCDLMGQKPPEGIDGISYLPTLLGKPELQQQHPYLYWEFKSYGAQQAVRMGKWKGYRKDVRNNPNPALELYDLDADPDESSNVAGSNPAIVAQIESIMAEAHVPSSYFPLLYGE